MFALTPMADIPPRGAEVRLVPKAPHRWLETALLARSVILGDSNRSAKRRYRVRHQTSKFLRLKRVCLQLSLHVQALKSQHRLKIIRLGKISG